MKLLEKWWAEYRAQIVPANASPSMEVEARKAFLSGVGCLFCEIVKEMEKPGRDNRSSLIDTVAEEICTFFNEQLSQGND